MRHLLTIALLLTSLNLIPAWADDTSTKEEHATPATEETSQAAADTSAPGAKATGPEYELDTRVEISGLELLPIEPDGELGAQSATNWLVRLIDPTESLDNAIRPDSATTASYKGVLDSPERIIAVLFDVPVDLSGGDAASTPVDVLIPVELDNTEATELDAIVSLSQTENREWVVDLNYEIMCGGVLQNRQRCRLYYGSGALVFDEDGDGIYETAATELDPDRNCLGGEQRWRRQGPRDGRGQGQGNGSGASNGPRDGRGRRQGGNGNGGGGRYGGK